MAFQKFYRDIVALSLVALSITSCSMQNSDKISSTEVSSTEVSLNEIGSNATSANVATTPSTLNLSNIKTSSRKPNVLLIVGDDHGYADLGISQYTNDVETPNLDQLASGGVRFTQAYATAPICNVSRTGLITGAYTQRFGGYWYGGKGLEDVNFDTLPEKLKKHGYSTGYVGKYHYGKNQKSTSRNFPNNHGFDSFYGFGGNGRKHYLIHNQAQQEQFQKSRKQNKTKGAKNGGGESLEMGPVWINDSKVDQVGFSTELIGQHANKFINENKNKPFFLQVAFNAVHNFTHQLPQSYLDEKGLNGYHDWDPSKENFREWYVNGRYPNNPEGREYYLGQLHFMDVGIGNILENLKKHGLADNTIVIYIGDNGGSTPIYANNGPLRGSKYTLYEGGIRVPLIIAGPNKFLKGQLNNDVVSAMDLYPTILNALGISAPDFLDGRDITPLLAGDTKQLKTRTLFWDSGHELVVRRGKWKYHAAFDPKYATKQMVNLELGEFLFNIEKDPGEQLDLSTKYPKIVAELKTAYQEWAKSNKPNKKITTLAKKNRKKINIL